MTDIQIKAFGYFTPRSTRYRAFSAIDTTVSFGTGFHVLSGEVDDEGFALSYLLSMYPPVRHHDVAGAEIALAVDGKPCTRVEVARQACYLDTKYNPLFSSRRRTVWQLLERGVKISGCEKTPYELAELFGLAEERLHRPVSAVGSEEWQAMCAIGYAHGKTLFCFPWFSRRLVAYNRVRLAMLKEWFRSSSCIALFPTSASTDALDIELSADWSG